MARGQQAVQAQQKNAKRKEKARKAARNKGTSQPGVLNAAAAAKSAKCKICMQLMQQLAADKPGSLKPLTAHLKNIEFHLIGLLKVQTVKKPLPLQLKFMKSAKHNY